MIYQAKGYHIGQRIPIKEIKSNWTYTCVNHDPTELLYELSEKSYVQVFDYGSVVFFGVPKSKQNEVLDQLQKWVAFERSDFMDEYFEIEINAEQPYKVLYDRLVVPSYSLALAKVVMFNLAQSVALDYYVEQSNLLLEETTVYSTELETRGRFSLRGKDLLKYIGRTLNLRNRIMANLYVFESPKMTWDDEILNKVDADLNRELDIALRYRSLQENVDTVQENLTVFKDLNQHAHSSTLEWIIIILIAVEIVNMFLEKM